MNRPKVVSLEEYAEVKNLRTALKWVLVCSGMSDKCAARAVSYLREDNMNSFKEIIRDHARSL